MSRDGGSGYKIYIFKEFIKRYTINHKSQRRKEVIYLHVADISCTQSIYKSTKLSYRGPYSLSQHAQTTMGDAKLV